MTLRCLAAVLVLSTVGLAGKFYEKASVTRMDTVRCSTPQARGFWSSLAGPAAAGDSACAEYTVQTEKVEYRLRPRRLVILPVGQEVDLRLTKKQVMIRIDDSVEDIECEVFSMRLVGDMPASRATRNTASRELR